MSDARAIGERHEPAATLSTHVTPGAGRIIGRPTRVVVRTEPVTVIGPVPFEPGMVRVRTANGRVVRASRDNVTLINEDAR